MAEKNEYSPLTKRDLLIAAMVTAGLAVFYFSLRSQNHPIDSVLYALAVEVKDAYPYFHWHHLLYTLLARLALDVARAGGYGGEAFAPMAAISAGAAAFAAAFLYLGLRRLGAEAAGAILATVGASFSAAWWYFAGEAEVLAIISFFLAGSVFLLASPRVSVKTSVAVACWLGVGTLCHQTLILFVPFATFILAWEGRARWKKVLVFLSLYGVVTIVPYIFIPYYYYEVGSLSEWGGWATYYASWGDWGRFTPARAARGAVTFLGSFVAGPRAFDLGRKISAGEFISSYLPAVLVAAAALAVIGAAGRRLWRLKKRWLITAAAWFASYHLFYSWWEPENAEWWIATTLPLWLLFGLAVPRRAAVRVAVSVLILAGAWFNFNRLVYPATIPGRNDAEAAARTIVSVTRPGDAVFISHLDVYAWIAYVSRDTRLLFTPFEGPGAGGAAELETAAAAGFREYLAEDKQLYLTDFEMDDASAPRDGDRLKAVYFEMLSSGEPVTVVRFPGGDRVLYRFNAYGRRFKDVRVFEAEEPASFDDHVVLGTSGASVGFNVDVSQDGRYVLCIQARGRPAGGAWPVMAVNLDGRPLGRVAVAAPYWCFHEAELDLTAGEHNVTVAFCNDFYDEATGANRDLCVNRVILFTRAE